MSKIPIYTQFIDFYKYFDYDELCTPAKVFFWFKIALVSSMIYAPRQTFPPFLLALIMLFFINKMCKNNKGSSWTLVLWPTILCIIFIICSVSSSMFLPKEQQPTHTSLTEQNIQIISDTDIKENIKETETTETK